MIHLTTLIFVMLTFTRSSLSFRLRSNAALNLQKTLVRQMSMKLQTGLVGLPNVGKSTLFNALVGSEAAQAANFPFCTIEPNVGIVNVPDPRLEKLSAIHKSAKVIPATMEFVDIAGIVKGASEGEGLGNKFLTNIRQTDAIVHVVRCFENPDVIHVDGSVDPIRDIDVINLELTLADLEQTEKRLEKCKKDRTQKKEIKDEISVLEKINTALTAGLPARSVDLSDEDLLLIKSLCLLTLKPVIYAANVKDDDLAEGNEMSKKVQELAIKENNSCVMVSAQVEAELASLEGDDRKEFLEALGVDENKVGLKALTQASYSILGLQTYFTSGPTETRAWTFRKGMSAPQAAGVIHTDFEKGFIRSETISYEDMIECGDEQAVKAAGKLRSEGKDYIMQEGDICLFRFNV